MRNKKALYSILDVVMSEYGWSIEYCLRLPHDVLTAFYNAILDRKHNDYYLKTKFMALAVNAGMTGEFKHIDKVFKKTKTDEKIDPLVWKNQLKALWLKMKRDPAEFERKWANGESIVL